MLHLSTPLGHSYTTSPPPLLGWGSATLPPATDSTRADASRLASTDDGGAAGPIVPTRPNPRLPADTAPRARPSTAAQSGPCAGPDPAGAHR